MKAQTLSNPRVSIPYLLTYLTSLIEIFLYQFILPFDCHLLMQRSAKWDPRKNPPSIIGLSQTLDSLTWSVHPTYWWRVASQIIWLLVVSRVSSTGNCTHCLPSRRPHSLAPYILMHYEDLFVFFLIPILDGLWHALWLPISYALWRPFVFFLIPIPDGRWHARVSDFLDHTDFPYMHDFVFVNGWFANCPSDLGMYGFPG